MSATQAALAASLHFPSEIAETMVAIGGAESGWDAGARGDYRNPGQGCSIGNACQGYCSFGIWQINICCHYSQLAPIAGVSSPCELATWLRDPRHNARAARFIYDDQGLGAWSTYNSGAYRGYLRQARTALKGVGAILSLPSAGGPGGGIGSGSAQAGPLPPETIAVGIVALSLVIAAVAR